MSLWPCWRRRWRGRRRRSRGEGGGTCGEQGGGVEGRERGGRGGRAVAIVLHFGVKVQSFAALSGIAWGSKAVKCETLSDLSRPSRAPFVRGYGNRGGVRGECPSHARPKSSSQLPLQPWLYRTAGTKSAHRKRGPPSSAMTQTWLLLSAHAIKKKKRPPPSTCPPAVVAAVAALANDARAVLGGGRRWARGLVLTLGSDGVVFLSGEPRPARLPFGPDAPPAPASLGPLLA